MKPSPSAIDIFRNKLYESALPNEFPKALCSYTETTRYFQDGQTTSLTINVEGTEFTVSVSTCGNDIIASVDLTAQLKIFSCHFHFSAVRLIGGLKSFRDFDDSILKIEDGTATLAYKCKNALKENVGFMDDKGGFTIKFQVNITRLDNTLKYKANLYNRLLRLDDAFTAKKFLNSTFADVLQTAKQELAVLKSNESFLEYCSSQKQLLQLDREEFLSTLKTRLKSNGLLFDIAATSSILYIFSKGSSKGSTSKVSTKGGSPEVPPIFVKGNKAQTLYMLNGAFVDACDIVQSLNYKPIPEETEWTSSIADLEQRIFNSGCQVFQSFFVSEVAKKVKETYVIISSFSVKSVKKPEKEVVQEEPDVDDEKKEVVQEEPDVNDEKVIDVDEKAYREALVNVAEVHTQCLGKDEELGDLYRERMNKISDSFPNNKWKYKLDLNISHHHFLAQGMASFHFRQEKNRQLEDEDCLVTPWNSVLSKKERKKEKKARKLINSKEEAADVGREGESHAFQYLKNKYKSPRYEVEWLNSGRESGLSYDILVTDREAIVTRDQYLYFEVKSTSIFGKEWFFLSYNQLWWAKQLLTRFTVLFLYVDMKKYNSTLKSTLKELKEYNNPAFHPNLKLTMTIVDDDDDDEYK